MDGRRPSRGAKIPSWIICKENINAIVCFDASMMMSSTPIWIVIHINHALAIGYSTAMFAHAREKESAKEARKECMSSGHAFSKCERMHSKTLGSAWTTTWVQVNMHCYIRGRETCQSHRCTGWLGELLFV